MILAVISYPYHYHITQLAIKHACRHIPNLTQVHVVWDDTTMAAPAGYIPFSKVCTIPSYIKGWYRQQVIKLNLHRILKSEFVILDGDVILNQEIDPRQNFYAPLMDPDFPHFNKVQDALGIAQHDFLSTRFMYTTSEWLANIHKQNTNLNELYFQIAMTDWSKSGRWPLSEWEVIYQYANNVLGLQKPILPFEFELCNTIEFENRFNYKQNFVLEGNDKFAPEFYEQHGIAINLDIWNFIYDPQNPVSNIG